MRTFLTFFLIVLDVAVLPFSCSTKNTKRMIVFETFYSLEDNTYIGDEYSYEVAKNETPVIEVPEEIVAEENGYEIVYWTIRGSEDSVSFPYNSCDEDFCMYWHGNRKCIVFIAHWEPVESNDD